MTGRVFCQALAGFACIFVALGSVSHAQSQSPGELAALAVPPRSIDDLLKVLDHYKPDPRIAESARAEADRAPPATKDRKDLTDFYRDRSRAAANVGRVSQQIEDLRLAVQHGQGGDGNELRVLYAELSGAESRGGNMLNALKLRELQAGLGMRPGQRIGAYANVAILNARLGDLPAAREALAKAEEALTAARSERGYATQQYRFAAQVERTRGQVATAEGKLVEAEEAFRKAVVAIEADAPVAKQRRFAAKGSDVGRDESQTREGTLRNHAGSLRGLGRFAEAELVNRLALQSALQRTGRYSVNTGATLGQLASILFDQGRYREVEILARETVDILEKSGAAPESNSLLNIRRTYGSVLAVQGKWPEASAEFEKVEQGLARDPLLLEMRGSGHIVWALALTRLGQPDKAIAMLSRMIERRRNRFGESHYETAVARGFLGIAYASAGQREPALREFGTAVPLLLDNTEDGEESNSAARTWRLVQILESYIGILVDMHGRDATPQGLEALAESFRLADVARGGSVQRALAASAARAGLGPQLGELARREQDLEYRVGALAGLLQNMLSAPPAQQLTKIIGELRRKIVALRQEHRKLKGEIEKRFPEYANLTDPRPPTVEQVRARLRAGEALISLYVAADRTYVWAIPKAGAAAVAVVPLGEAEIARRVAHLRKALDANATTADDIPRFDVAAAFTLYSELLKPIEAAWGQAQSLLIVPHLALGQLPFALLPTAAATLPAKEGIQFESYRAVEWLARRAAVTQLPSANTLITLRSAAPGDPSRRAFAGFGDPFFSRQQAAEGALQLATSTKGAAVMMRSAPKLDGMSTAGLAQLPRLPDTRDEILEVARAMNADTNQDVFLGERATVKVVKSMALDNRKVIHFATHGLIPGDLDGLTQPALALTSSDVAGGDSGDGLLKMADILGMKLNADWVVLSACNTASGDGSAGTEAVAGLGRAFFFAGARSLLVSNWPVESVSARKLMTSLFQRQAADASLDRAQALRQTMLELIDTGGATDPATKSLSYSYAHPLFWAPFALVGDTGAR